MHINVACAGGAPKNAPDWYRQAMHEEAHSYPRLRDVPRTSDANTRRYRVHGELRWSNRTGATGWLGCIKPDRWRWSDVCHHHDLIGHRA